MSANPVVGAGKWATWKPSVACPPLVCSVVTLVNGAPPRKSAALKLF
jgi:hypothetical protein